MIQLAVLGNPINHSLSPKLHQHFAKQTGIKLSYQALCVQPSQFESTVKTLFQQGGHGLNITLPFKQKAYNLCDQLTIRAQQAGAVNTLWLHQGLLYGDNTDGMGFYHDLKQHISLAKKRILIIGAGGATKGILPILTQSDIQHLHIANRTLAHADALRSHHSFNTCTVTISDLTRIPLMPFDIIIHASSIRSFEQSIKLPEDILTHANMLYDLNYDVCKITPFLQINTRHHHVTQDGLGMLIHQGALSFQQWTGIYPTWDSLEFKKTCQEHSTNP